MSDPADLTHLYGSNARDKSGSFLKSLYKFAAIPGMTGLAGGLPNVAYFPYDTLEATIAPSDRLQGGQEPSSASGRVTVPKISKDTDPSTLVDLSTALQYGTAQGYPALYSWLKEFTKTYMHPGIPYAGSADIILTCGNTDGFRKVIELFSNEWHPETRPSEDQQSILVEKFTYGSAVQSAVGRGLHPVPVEIDENGMIAEGPGGLRDVLENWESKGEKRPLPHLMYLVTSGQNPTGAVMPIERRKAIYDLCHDYDIVIIEDEPYWFLEYDVKNEEGRFLESLTPSFLSIDVDGRVVRLDTFSKSVAPGCRLGWITAQPKVVERILRITESSTQQPSGFVQSLIIKMITDKADGWSFEGWTNWLESLRNTYKSRMLAMCDTLAEHQAILDSTDISPYFGSSTSGEWSQVEKTNIYEFKRPAGGMFVWIRINFEKHPLYGQIYHTALSQACWAFAASKPFLVLSAPGTGFTADETIIDQGAFYFRLCFAAIDADNIIASTKRFAESIHKFWTLSEEEIREILRSLEDDTAVNALEMSSKYNPMLIPHYC